MKKLLFLVASCFLLFSVAFVKSDEYTIMRDFYGLSAQCYPSGQVKLELSQSEFTIVHLDRIIKGKGGKTLTGSYFPITGKWYDEKFNEVTTIGDDRSVFFISDEFLFRYPTNYTVTFAGIPIEVVELYTDVSTVDYNISCPGYMHACRFLDPTIINCSTGDAFFSAYFTGLGEKEFAFVNLTRDLEFTLNYETYSMGYLGYKTELPKNYTLRRVGNDTYLLRIPSIDLKNKISSLKIHVTGCIEGFHNTSDYKTCTFPFKAAQPTNISKEPVAKEFNITLSNTILWMNETEYCISLLMPRYILQERNLSINETHVGTEKPSTYFMSVIWYLKKLIQII
jgi:hypothetical protein